MSQLGPEITPNPYTSTEEFEILPDEIVCQQINQIHVRIHLMLHTNAFNDLPGALS